MLLVELAALSALLEEAAGAAAGVEVDAGGLANAVPAIRVAATAGTRYFNIDVISRKIRCLRCLARVGAQAPQLEARVLSLKSAHPSAS